MQKIYKIILISTLLLCITTPLFAADVNELQNQKSEIQEQINKTNEELNSVNEDLTENLKQVQKLDENIQINEETINKLNEDISKIEIEIKKIEKELQDATIVYTKQKSLLDARLVEIYEAGDTNYLEIVLGAKSISDFFATYYIVSELTSYDIELLEFVENKKNEIEQNKKILDEQRKDLENKERTAAKTKIALSNTKVLRQNYISKLSQEEQDLQAKIDEYNSKINSIETEIRSLAKIINFGEDYSGGPMKWPIAGHYNITSNYGMRVHPITGVYKLHTGVDISASMGTEFTAIANGVVVKAEYNSAYGNMVIIDHGGGVQTLYAHGSEIVAQLGQVVNAGDVILKVGSTGYSTGPHAHFEVRVNGNPMNPLDYVSIPEN
ncbi:MAG: peptidoglycan DD-metalloendopeptidase family protein [Clostridia bacterium]|nr:peptidoglycan DD-metalloendopeptidase family protein [Clostridia bacterium]